MHVAATGLLVIVAVGSTGCVGRVSIYPLILYFTFFVGIPPYNS